MVLHLTPPSLYSIDGDYKGIEVCYLLSFVASEEEQSELWQNSSL